MLGRSRCAQTQHEMRIIRRWGVVPGNEVEWRENKVARVSLKVFALGVKFYEEITK